MFGNKRHEDIDSPPFLLDNDPLYGEQLVIQITSRSSSPLLLCVQTKSLLVLSRIIPGTTSAPLYKHMLLLATRGNTTIVVCMWGIFSIFYLSIDCILMSIYYPLYSMVRCCRSRIDYLLSPIPVFKASRTHLSPLPSQD